MTLLLFTVAAGVAVGYLRGGRLRNLASVRLRAIWLVFAAVGAQAALALLVRAGIPGSVVAVPLLGLSQLLLLSFLWANRMLPGMLLVFLGFAMNAAVIVANGGMPVDEEALRAVATGPSDFAAGKHRLLRPGDPLPLLADVIALPPLVVVVSAGDVVLAAGVAILLSDLMLRHPPQPGRRARRGSGA
ncbi:MAG: DUF5317 family protein [Euzebyales bacterium]|nr:DUF5317 family protein [Euzebyales bacterium]MBA3622757.1 DUF5317 family protein [Euzebyales bacterium]